MSVAFGKVQDFFQHLVQELEKKGLKVMVTKDDSFLTLETIPEEEEGSPVIYAQAHLIKFDINRYVDFRAFVLTPQMGLRPGCGGSPQINLLNAIRDRARILYPSLLQQDGYEGYFLNFSDDSADVVFKEPVKLAEELLSAALFYKPIFIAAMQQFEKIQERAKKYERAMLGAEALRLIADNSCGLVT